MLLLGLVGGIASGKTLVAGCFRDLGAVVLNADEAGHQVLRDAEVIAVLNNRWGESILDSNGQISRPAVAKIVFAPGNIAEKAFLESVTHPRIQINLEQQLAELQSQPSPPPLAVLDAALLFEAGWDAICDFVVFVDCPRYLRLKRALSRGWSAEQFAARETAQMAIDDKRARSDFVLDNSQSPENTAGQVQALWQQLLAKHAS